MLEYDDTASRRVEAAYTTADVVEQRRRVLAALDLRPGERVVDVGSGPGFLAVQLAEAVGPDGAVTGVDASDSMLALAREREVPAGSAPLTWLLGTATELPLPDASVDVAVSTQVLEYVADIGTALVEVYRVLRPGGRLLILDTDWDSIVWHSRDRDRMARVLTAWEPHLADPHLPRTLGGSLRTAGFVVHRPFVLPLLNVGYDADTFSGLLLELVATFVAGRGFPADEAQAWAEDLRTMGEDYFFSLNRYVFTATRPV